MSRAYEIALKRAGQNKLSAEAIKRQEYLDNKIQEVRLRLDPILHRIYKADKLKKERSLNPAEQKVYDDLLLTKRDFISQIDALQKELNITY